MTQELSISRRRVESKERLVGDAEENQPVARVPNSGVGIRVLETVAPGDYGLVGMGFGMDAAECDGGRGFAGLEDRQAAAAELVEEVEPGEVGGGEGAAEVVGEGSEAEDVVDGEAGEDIEEDIFGEKWRIHCCVWLMEVLFVFWLFRFHMHRV